MEDEFDRQLEEILAGQGSQEPRQRVSLVGRTGAAKKPVVMEYLRDMTQEDLLELALPAEVKLPAIQRLRYSHHRLARLVALGKRGMDVSEMTGYSQARVSVFMNDPAFLELVSHYEKMVDGDYAEVMEELTDFGMDMIHAARERFEENPEEFSTGELFKYGGDLLGRTVAPDKGKSPTVPAGPAAKTNINIALVAPQPQPRLVEAKAKVVIEDEVEDGDFDD